MGRRPRFGLGLDRVGSGLAHEREGRGPGLRMGETPEGCGDVEEEATPYRPIQGCGGGLGGLAVDEGEVDEALPGGFLGEKGEEKGPNGGSNPPGAGETLDRPCRP